MTRSQKLLIGAAIVSAAVWLVPGGRLLLYPLSLLNTHLHELAHALAALATGGAVQRIEVYADTSGVTPISGGFLPLIASAGYVGASLWGALMIARSRAAKGAQGMLMATGVLLAISTVLFVRGDAIGFAFGGLWAAGLIVMARRLKGEGAQFAAQFLGVQQCAASALAFAPLLDASLANAHSDAELMERALLLPGPVWAVVWMAMSLLLMGAGLRVAWSGSAAQKA